MPEAGDAVDSKEVQHKWMWMAESYDPNDDGETTTKRDYYECADCGETKVEKTQLDWVQRTPERSNPAARWSK